MQEEGTDVKAKKMRILEFHEKDIGQLRRYLFEIGTGDALEDFGVWESTKFSLNFYFFIYDDKQQEFLNKKI